MDISFKTDSYLLHEVFKKTKTTKLIKQNSKIHFEGTMDGGNKSYNKLKSMDFQLFINDIATDVFLPQRKLPSFLTDFLKVQNLSKVSLSDKEYFKNLNKVSTTQEDLVILDEVNRILQNSEEIFKDLQKFSHQKNFEDFSFSSERSSRKDENLVEFIQKNNSQLFLIQIKEEEIYDSNGFIVETSISIEKFEFQI